MGRQVRELILLQVRDIQQKIQQLGRYLGHYLGRSVGRQVAITLGTYTLDTNMCRVRSRSRVYLGTSASPLQQLQVHKLDSIYYLGRYLRLINNYHRSLLSYYHQNDNTVLREARNLCSKQQNTQSTIQLLAQHPQICKQIPLVLLRTLQSSFL